MDPVPASPRLALVGAISLAGVVLAGVIDFATGTELRTYPLYFIPIAYAAWRLSRGSVLGLALLSATSWALSNLVAGLSYSRSWIWVWNFCAQALSFGLVGYLIAGLRRRLRAEQEASRTDLLTGLLNRRGFYERADLLLAVAHRSNVPVTLAFLDLDNFKTVNDRYGHETGDRALTTASELLKRHVRATDLVARLGGDEFAVFLMGAGPDPARTSLERLREMVSMAMREQAWPITASVGALVFLQAPESTERSLQEADALMYRAKASGKNRLHLQIVP
ncbi:MAG TPA: GGDEF domain-containing protein [Polyangiaceae bacterium]|nr:GGDEF domain-containing protein [Polyangiaceae bacterium]